MNLRFLAKKDDKYGHYGFLFIIPFFLFLTIFVVYPIVYSFILSFFRWNGNTDPVNIGFENYSRIIEDQFFYKSLFNTFVIWIVGVVPQMLLGLFLAVLLTSKTIKGTGFFRAIFYLPNLITMASVAVLFWFILNERTGLLNLILIKLNIISEPIFWMGNETSLRLSISFILWWMWYGYTMIIFMAGLKAIPDQLYDAASVDGANKKQSFWYITLPLLRPIILYQVVTSIIGGMTMFDIPYVLAGQSGGTGNAAMTTVMYLYRMGFYVYSYGYAATIGVVIFIINLVFVLAAFRLMYRNVTFS